MPLPQLRRVRWAVRATLTLGVAASVAANILHALPNPISQMIAAWPPLALLLTVELISRVPVHRRSLAAVRLGATTAIAGIAAWVSYWHMAGVAARYGESGASPYLLPLSVDGLVIVASVSLVELAGRIRVGESGPLEAAAGKPAAARPAGQPPAVTRAAAGATMQATAPDGATVITRPTPSRVAKAAAAKAAPGKAAAAKAAPAKAAPARAAAAKAAPAKTAPRKRVPATTAGDHAAATLAADQAAATLAGDQAVATTAADQAAADMAELAARLKADQPGLTQAAIAAELGITTQRLRQINRQRVAA
jgi:hypothetical protein